MEPFISFLPLVILILVFYFLVFRPQQQQRKRHIEMVATLKRGDTIITNGGFKCEVIRQEDKYIKVRLGENQVQLSKDYVAYKVDEFLDDSHIDEKSNDKK